MNPKILFIAAVIVMIALVSCGNSHGDTSIPLPEYISEITLDEDNNITNMGRAGESTPDGNYYYHGSVRLYSDDGDFMLYLSLGTLLTQMGKDGVTLRIALLKPDYENLAIKDIPLSLTSSELNFLLNKNESH